jgi:diaminohydroxyphosphoribosylaminopyrimidine deaminase / 5-amino-6-(5-phosphoribosylamino)uracil reductase
MPATERPSTTDETFMRMALGLARRAYGDTSPNPLVGAVLVRKGQIIGRGWHRRAGGPHAEIEALADAARRGQDPRGATLYVTLEPCCTHGRTPPCTDALIAAGIQRVVIGATDPNPAHRGRAFELLRRADIEIAEDVLAEQATALNATFNHWIVHRTPFVMVKAAMSLDGKIATANGESKWITSPASRAKAMRLRRGVDAILVGVNTVIADDPALSVRSVPGFAIPKEVRQPRRIIVDSAARTPVDAKLVSDAHASLTTVVTTRRASRIQRERLSRRANVWVAPTARDGGVDLGWLIKKLGAENVTHLLVEGGGEVNASFLFGRLAHRIAFFYAPKILGGRAARKGVAGGGVADATWGLKLHSMKWQRVGPDLLLTASLD